MNPQDIAHRLTEMQTELVNKLGCQPFLDLSAEVRQSGRVSIPVYGEYKNGSYDFGTGQRSYEIGTASGDTFEQALDAAARIIADLPSAKDRGLHEFMGALGRVIDLGRKNGVDVSYINPLQGTMERLSSNALTCRAAVA